MRRHMHIHLFSGKGIHKKLLSSYLLGSHHYTKHFQQNDKVGHGHHNLNNAVTTKGHSHRLKPLKFKF